MGLAGKGVDCAKRVNPVIICYLVFSDTKVLHYEFIVATRCCALLQCYSAAVGTYGVTSI